MNLLDHCSEISHSPCYNRNPRAAALYTWAKMVYARNRASSPLEILSSLGLDPDVCRSGLDRWFPLLEDTFRRVRAKEGQQGGISIEDGIILYGVTRAVKPEIMIETGVAAGVSNSFISAALIENGHGLLYSIELPASEGAGRLLQDGGSFAWPLTGTGWAVPGKIREAIGDRNILILEDTRTALPKLLSTLPKVDIFFHDDLHTPEHMYWEYNLVWPKIPTGGMLISDDSNYGWLRFCREQGISAGASFNIQRLTALRK